MLSAKMYRTAETDEHYCDGCSIIVARHNHAVAMVRAEAGKPCRCDMCGGKFRAK